MRAGLASVASRRALPRPPRPAARAGPATPALAASRFPIPHRAGFCEPRRTLSRRNSHNPDFVWRGGRCPVWRAFKSAPPNKIKPVMEICVVLDRVLRGSKHRPNYVGDGERAGNRSGGSDGFLHPHPLPIRARQGPKGCGFGRGWWPSGPTLQPGGCGRARQKKARASSHAQRDGPASHHPRASLGTAGRETQKQRAAPPPAFPNWDNPEKRCHRCPLFYRHQTRTAINKG